MDYKKIGNLIFSARKELGMTQRQLADEMHISDKTISKWERGLGCPDVSLLLKLSHLLGINMDQLLGGDLETNEIIGGNMKNTKYYVCPDCGNLILSTGEASISCCGKNFKAEKLQKADENNDVDISLVEDEWFVTTNHEMTKEHFISFAVFATGDKLQIFKQYPEWSMQIRIPKRSHGTLLWYCNKHGLFYKYL